MNYINLTAALDNINELNKRLTAMTEQRDRLAEAIITHRAKAFPLTGEDFDQELWQALQSLTQNDPDPHRFCRAGKGNIIHCTCNP
jgi:hypothetical protein